MQVAGAVATEPERREQSLLLAEQFPGDQRADPDHLVAVVGVGDDVGVLPEHVEDREAVRGEGADPAGGLVPVQVALALEPLVAVREGGGPHPDEVLRHRVVGTGRAVRVHGHVAGRAVDDIRRGPALDPAEVEVGLVVDPPHPVGDEVARDVVVERRAGIDVQDGREAAPVVGELAGVHGQRPLLQGPVGPHRLGLGDRTAGEGDRDLGGQVQHRPQVTDPRPGRDDELVAPHLAPVGVHRGDRAAAGVQAGDPDVRHDPNALGRCLRGQALQ